MGLQRHIPGILTVQDTDCGMHLISYLCLHAGKITAQELGTFVIVLTSLNFICSQKIAETAELLADGGNLRYSGQVYETVAEQVILNLYMALTALESI